MGRNRSVLSRLVAAGEAAPVPMTEARAAPGGPARMTPPPPCSITNPHVIGKTMQRFSGPSVTVVTHPLVQHKLALLRRVSTTTAEFRVVVREISPAAGLRGDA